jgi:hypothetical protein
MKHLTAFLPRLPNTSESDITTARSNREIELAVIKDKIGAYHLARARAGSDAETLQPITVTATQSHFPRPFLPISYC